MIIIFLGVEANTYRKAVNSFSQKLHCSQSVLGLLYGQNKAGDAEGRQRSNKVDDLMMNRFKEKCGS